ncbi:MAG: DNA polymerase III subunit gamma/tau [Treponema sp.]|nr:DNA polymerase III subunit gamma/tau [Treponema sp.]
MSYEVTATRRRPQTFDDLVGQEFVAETLKNSIKSGKIAHAFLFSGPRGCGKTSTARILAKALNCANGPTDCPCGKCSNCVEITKGTNMDVIEIDGASNTSVENIRQIKDEVLFPPANCRYKIYIIDEVHMLSTSAFNALLKTIEEPPPYVIFIFATTELQKVPATIKSRCQHFNFRLVAIDKVKQCLAEAAAELNIQADDEALFWIARESTGSMRDAYTLFDQVVAFSDGHITYDKIRDKLGLVGLDRLNTIFEACAQSDSEKVINMLDEFLQAGISIEQLISNAADYLRSLLLIKSNISKESLLGNSVERYSRLVLNAWNSVQIERALSIFLQLYRDTRYSLSPRYELELAFSRLCWIGQYVSNSEVKKAIDAAQALLAGAPVNNSSPKIGAVENSKPQQINNQVNNGQAGQAVWGEKPVEKKDIPDQNKIFKSQENHSFSNNQESPVNQNVWGSNKYSENVKSTETSIGSDGLPTSLPKLSILRELEEKEAAGGGGGDSQDLGEGSNPFYNGGSLPPKKSVTINQIIQNAKNETFTDNPDLEGDDWSNIDDEPPADDYYVESDEARYNKLEESYEKEEELAQASMQAPLQNDETFTTADGKNLTIAQLRGNVLAGLAVNNSFITTTLQQTGAWKIENDIVKTSVENSYELSLLQKNQQIISQEISNVCSKKMLFQVELEEQNTGPVKKIEIPRQVSLLVDMFKGKIVGQE